MTDLVERIAMAIRDVEFPDAVVDDNFRKAARAAIVECFKWRPIEEAPRDGTTILACWPQQGNLMMLVWYSSVQGFWLRTGREPVIPMQATHWMPIPKPPKEFAP